MSSAFLKLPKTRRRGAFYCRNLLFQNCFSAEFLYNAKYSRIILIVFPGRAALQGVFMPLLFSVMSSICAGGFSAFTFYWEYRLNQRRGQAAGADCGKADQGRSGNKGYRTVCM